MPPILSVTQVVPCTKTYAHSWSSCPCAHPGETARRRDPTLFNYQPVLCPNVKSVSNRVRCRAVRGPVLPRLRLKTRPGFGHTAYAVCAYAVRLATFRPRTCSRPRPNSTWKAVMLSVPLVAPSADSSAADGRPVAASRGVAASAVGARTRGSAFLKHIHITRRPTLPMPHQ
jgi:hypothetical protein